MRRGWTGTSWRPWLIVLIGWLWGLQAYAGTTVPKVSVKLIVTNAQGTVVATMTPQGQVTYTAGYRPYGQQVEGTPQAGPGYTGHVNDPDSGLVYMQQRYYDPATGRFISPDLVAPAPGNVFNFGRYTYANDNPVRYTDPDGRCADGTCGVMVQNYGKWANAHPKEANKIGRNIGVPIVIVMASATGVSEAGVVIALARASAKVIARKVLSHITKKDGLGKNPFKGKTPKQIDKMLRGNGFEHRGPDPLNGKGGYVNPQTERSYHIDPGGKYKRGTEYSHVDVNRTNGSKLPKRKYPLGDKLNDNQ